MKRRRVVTSGTSPTLAGVALAGLGTTAWNPERALRQEGIYHPPPGDAWERPAPEDVGLRPDLIAHAVAYARTHDSRTVAYDFSGHEETFGALAGPLPASRAQAGIPFQHGYIVAEWGETDGVGSLLRLRSGIWVECDLVRQATPPRSRPAVVRLERTRVLRPTAPRGGKSARGQPSLRLRPRTAQQ